MNCWSCTKWKLRDKPEMAKQGFAACEMDKKWVFYAAQHSCPKHSPAQTEASEQRKQWLTRNKRM